MVSTEFNPWIFHGAGNIGRFINHSCKSNARVVPIMTPGSSAIYYSIGIFSDGRIPAGQEITINYKYKIDGLPGRVLMCNCGTPSCKGRLL